MNLVSMLARSTRFVGTANRQQILEPLAYGAKGRGNTQDYHNDSLPVNLKRAEFRAAPGFGGNQGPIRYQG